jgi:hypothetical protein
MRCSWGASLTADDSNATKLRQCHHQHYSCLCALHDALSSLTDLPSNVVDEVEVFVS